MPVENSFKIFLYFITPLYYIKASRIGAGVGRGEEATTGTGTGTRPGIPVPAGYGPILVVAKTILKKDLSIIKVTIRCLMLTILLNFLFSLDINRICRFFKQQPLMLSN